MLFYGQFRDKITSSAIITALITEGVLPVININKAKNIAVITLILRLETFIVLSKVVSPIRIIPYVSPRYGQNMINTTFSKIFDYIVR